MDLTVNVAPVVDAGIDKQLCFPDSVELSDASFSGSTSTVTWSGGAGTFYPNNTTLNAWYVPDASEIGTTVLLTITSDDPDGAGPGVHAPGWTVELVAGRYIQQEPAVIQAHLDKFQWLDAAAQQRVMSDLARPEGLEPPTLRSEV